jgi:hypothetical protein
MPSGAVTFTVTTQEPLLAIAPPVRLMVPDPAVAVAVPPQVEVKPLGLATVRPEGSESVKATPVNPTKPFGLATEKLTALVPPGRIFAGVNALVIMGGDTTRSVAEAVFPVPTILAATLPETLFCTPADVPLTVMLMVQDPAAGIAPPEKKIAVGESPSAPPQVSLVAPVTVNPAGIESMKLTPDMETAFRFVMVKVRVVFPPNGIEEAPNALLIDGG